VRSVHDLHVWTVTAGFRAIAAHVVVARDTDRDLIRRRLELTLGERFGIEHTTLQMEEEAEPGLLRVENAPEDA
jgi:cobalt-zinc-cadmium efflux system protein